LQKFKLDIAACNEEAAAPAGSKEEEDDTTEEEGSAPDAGVVEFEDGGGTAISIVKPVADSVRNLAGAENAKSAAIGVRGGIAALVGLLATAALAA
jgi:hypothetical protein